MVCAQEAYWQLGLDGVVLMPLGRPSHRAIDSDPGPEERYRLCEAAAQGVDWLTVSRVEIDRPGPTFTVDTLEELREANPGDEYVSCWAPTRRCAWRAGASRSACWSWRGWPWRSVAGTARGVRAASARLGGEGG